MSTDYAVKIREHLENMTDRTRSQNAAAHVLINMFPDYDRQNGSSGRPHGFHAKFRDGVNRRIFNSTLREFGLVGVTDIGLANQPMGLAKHIDNSQTKRLSQHAYAVRQLSEEERILTFLTVCRIEPTLRAKSVVRLMVSRFESTTGPMPHEVDAILEIEDQRVPPDLEVEPKQNELFVTDHVHIWVSEDAALCGSLERHMCPNEKDLSIFGYELSFSTNATCSGCGTSICAKCLEMQ